MQPVEIERSKYALTADDTITGDVDGIDAAWVAEALKKAFGLIERRDESEAESAFAPQVHPARPRHPEPPRLKTLRVG